MKASDYIVKFLTEHNIEYVFGYIGGMVTHIVDSIYKHPNIEMVNAICEQGAGFAAEGYARITGNIGVAIATSGPGATNLLTPLASCFFDSTPALFITGQVNTFEYRKFPNIRQCGFQETNIVDMSKPVTKYAVQVNKVEDLRYELEKSFYIAQTGRKGPVLIDLPMDIQRMDYDFDNARPFCAEKCLKKLHLEIEINQTKEILAHAKRPMILIGNGIRLSGCTEKFRYFAETRKIPIVCSLLGLDNAISDYKYNLGMIGTYGNRGANIAMTMADVLLVLGSRLDLRQIGTKLDVFQNTKIIQVDIDDAELACDNLSKLCVKCDVKEFLSYFEDFRLSRPITPWLNKLTQLKECFVSDRNIDNSPLIANKIIKLISNNLRDNDIICADVGQHQMWVGQSLNVKKNTRVLFSGGLGAMGFALPAAIGSAITGRRSIVIAGDGGIQMNIQELEVIKRRNLPIKIIVMNNRSLAMVRQFQDAYFEGRNPSTVEDYSAPDFAKIAQAYGIVGIKKNVSEISNTFLNNVLYDDTPMVLDIVLDVPTQLYPKVLFGNSIDNMYPLLDGNKLKKIKDMPDD